MLFTKSFALAAMAVMGANGNALPPARPNRPAAPQFNAQTINCGAGAARESFLSLL
jgi:hypothetical protein